MDEHNTFTLSPEYIKWSRQWLSSIYLKIQDFMSRFQYELMAWYAHTHSEGNLFLDYSIKATRKKTVVRPHLWVWTTCFSRIRDRVKGELNSQEMRGLERILEGEKLKELRVWHEEGGEGEGENDDDWGISIAFFRHLDMVATGAEPEPKAESLRKRIISWLGRRHFC